MKREFIKGLLPDIDKDILNQIMDANGADIETAKAGIDELKEKLEAANATINDYNEKIKAMEAESADNNSLKEKITELQNQIDARAKADEDARAEEAQLKRFAAVAEGKDFVNSFTKDGIMAEFRKAIGDKTYEGKSDAEIYEAITSGKDGIYNNPNPIAEIPGTGTVDIDLVEENKARQVMGLPPKDKN